jgi:hypothetical protein
MSMILGLCQIQVTYYSDTLLDEYVKGKGEWKAKTTIEVNVFREM